MNYGSAYSSHVNLCSDIKMLRKVNGTRESSETTMELIMWFKADWNFMHKLFLSEKCDLGEKTIVKVRSGSYNESAV